MGMFSFTDEEYALWNKRHEEAKRNTAMMQEYGYGILIEVAAQHPLVNHRYVGVEFKARLDKAIAIYQECLARENCVHIIVPGSVHKGPDGEQDEVSLAEAGNTYISICDPSIQFIDLDIALTATGMSGIYNSVDECQLVATLAKKMNCSHVISICSGPQVFRKSLAYIRFGVVPEFQTVCLPRMHHDYVWEYFKGVPAMLSEDSQFDVVEGKR